MRDDRDADDAAEFSYEGADEDAPPTAERRSRASGDETETPADAPAGAAPADESAAADADDRLADVAGTRIADVRSAARDDADDAFAELFEAAAVDEIDSDRVWAHLQAEDSGPRVDVQDRRVREFDKRSYCHQCPHFSEPPAVSCGHEGTTILELVDVRTFRVANCPVVLEEESLEER